MIKLIDKYDILRTRLVPGEKFDSQVIKKLNDHRSVISIKGHPVVVESDTPLSENRTLSFLVSGFNDKGKTVLLKMLSGNPHFNKGRIFPDSSGYIPLFLQKNRLPFNKVTSEIASYLLLKENDLDKEKLLFIYKYWKKMADTPLLYKMYHFRLTSEQISLLLQLFSDCLEEGSVFAKVKKNTSDNIISRKKWYFSGVLSDVREKLRQLLDQRELVDGLLRENDRMEQILSLYPLIANTRNELNYFCFLEFPEKRYLSKLNVLNNEDMFRFAIDIGQGEDRIAYKFYLIPKEKRALLFAGSRNEKWIKGLQNAGEELRSRIEKKLGMKTELYIYDGETAEQDPGDHIYYA